MKKRRLMALLLSVCVGISMFPMMAFADDGSTGETKPTATDAKYFKFEKDYGNDDYSSWEITRYTGKDSTVVFPSSYKGKDVTSICIENEAKTVKELIVPEGVKSVDWYGCEKVKSVTLPKSVKRIDYFGDFNLRIDAPCGSYAEKWALQNDLDWAGGKTCKTLTKATPKKDGKLTNTCNKCNTSYTGKIKKASFDGFACLSKNHTTCYTGKKVNSKVDLSSGNFYLAEGRDYVVKRPAGLKNIGKYSFTITLKGNYSGTMKETLVIASPATKIKKLSRGKKSFTVKWKKTKQTSGYLIKYSTSSYMKKAKTINVKSSKKVSKKVTKLKKKKTYYVEVLPYKIVKGKKYVCPVSDTKKVKTK